MTKIFPYGRGRDTITQARAQAEDERRWAEVAYGQPFVVENRDDHNDYSVSGHFVVRPA